MSIYILDCESTGISKKDQVIELAYMDINPEFTLGNFKEAHRAIKEPSETFRRSMDWVHSNISKRNTFRYKPSVPINPHAEAVHGISAKDLKDSPHSTKVKLPSDITYMIGHNITFDRRMIEQSNPGLKPTLDKIKYICTLDLARCLSKHHKISYENHKLDTLVAHYLPDHTQYLITDTHSASMDVVKTFLVLMEMLEHLEGITSYEELYNFQENLKKVKA